MRLNLSLSSTTNGYFDPAGSSKCPFRPIALDRRAKVEPSTVPDVAARVQRYEIAAFVRNARAVSSDAQVEHLMVDSLLAHARGAADKFLDAYYHSDGFTHNPFKLFEKQTVSIQIDSILQLSPNSYKV